ncbi:MAG: SnoaL-like domain-containing protein [Gemmatimonadota bacterium]|nr:nuclear transport factor 2 family protein [Gemmatimonadota bacterium]
MKTVAELDHEVNQAILSGRALEAFETHYADDVVMQEPGVEPFVGKDRNRAREQEFFASVEDFHGAELVASAVDGDTTFSEWMWDVTLKGVGRIRMEQVARRRWKDGKIVHERFYYTKG